MVKKFTHHTGNIEVTKEQDIIKVNPIQKQGHIEVNSNQSKESFFKEVEDKMNLMYAGYPSVVKEFIIWLQDVI